MSKITAQDIKDLGFTASLFNPLVQNADAEVVVSGLNYVCIAPHVSASDNQPGTGANWQTYWIQAGFNGTAWVTATSYACPFKTFIDGAIANQSKQLQGRIGLTRYNDTTSPNVDYVFDAELSLTAAEMVQRRINIVLGFSSGKDNPSDTRSEQQQRKDYLDQADMWVEKIVAGGGEDSVSFACGSLVTSHFDESSS